MLINVFGRRKTMIFYVSYKYSDDDDNDVVHRLIFYILILLCVSHSLYALYVSISMCLMSVCIIKTLSMVSRTINRKEKK